MSSPGTTTSTRLSPPMLTGEEISKRSPWLADFGRAQATRLVRGLGSQVGDHDRVAAPGGAGKVPAAASTLMVPVFSATPPVAEVVKTIV